MAALFFIFRDDPRRGIWLSQEAMGPWNQKQNPFGKTDIFYRSNSKSTLIRQPLYFWSFHFSAFSRCLGTVEHAHEFPVPRNPCNFSRTQISRIFQRPSSDQFLARARKIGLKFALARIFANRCVLRAPLPLNQTNSKTRTNGSPCRRNYFTAPSMQQAEVWFCHCSSIKRCSITKYV